MMTWQLHLKRAISKSDTRTWSPGRGARLQKTASSQHNRSRLRALLVRVQEAARTGEGFGVRISTEGRIGDMVKVSDGDALRKEIGCTMFQMVPVHTQMPACPLVEVWLDEEGLLNGGDLNRTATQYFSPVNAGEFHGNVVIAAPGVVP